MLNESETRDWNRKKIELHKMYPFLTDADLLMRDGEFIDLLKEIAARIGISWKELDEIVRKL